MNCAVTQEIRCGKCHFEINQQNPLGGYSTTKGYICQRCSNYNPSEALQLGTIARLRNTSARRKMREEDIDDEEEDLEIKTNKPKVTWKQVLHRVKECGKDHFQRLWNKDPELRNLFNGYAEAENFALRYNYWSNSFGNMVKMVRDMKRHRYIELGK